MIGRILRQFSLDTGIGQKEVAAALKYSPQRVNNYYRDIAEPPPEFFDAFRKAYKIDLRKLSDREQKELIAPFKTLHPIPVFDIDYNPVSDPDFLLHTEAARYYIDAPMMQDCAAIVKVSGEAMLPDYKPSDLIALRKISDFNNVPFGSPFYIVTQEQKLLRILKPEDKQSFRLHALNNNFDDITVSRVDIKHLFQVMFKLSRIN